MKKPLAKMRKLAGITQADLAEMVGTSRVYIGKFEIGTEKMSPAMAKRISAQTGISPDWVRGTNPDNPVTIDGQKFTEQTYRCWRDIITKSGETQIQEVVKAYSELLSLIHAAVEHYSKANKTGLLATRLQKAKFDLNDAFTNDLDEESKEALTQLHKKLSETAESVASKVRMTLQPISEGVDNSIKQFQETMTKNIEKMEQQLREEYSEEELKMTFKELEEKRSSPKKKRKG